MFKNGKDPQGEGFESISLSGLSSVVQGALESLPQTSFFGLIVIIFAQSATNILLI